MTTLLAIAWDSFREATDRSISSIVLMVSVLLGVCALAIGFQQVPVEDLVLVSAKEAGYPRSATVTRVDERAVDFGLARPPAPAVTEPPAMTEAPPLPPGPPEDPRSGRGRRRGGARGGEFREYDHVADGGEGGDGAKIGREHAARAVERMQTILERRGVKSVVASDPPGAATAPEATIRLTLDYDPIRTRGAMKLHFPFGTFDLDRKLREDANVYVGMSAMEVLIMFEGLIVNGLAGFFGLIIAVIATAGFVPTMLSGGTAHLLLAKPVRRHTLLLGKYVGGVAFVAFHALVLSSLIVLAIYIRTGLFEARLLVAPLSLASVFAILYAASCLAGVLFETSVVSIFAALSVWMLSFSAVTMHNVVHNIDRFMPGEKVEVPEKLRRGVDIVYFVVPKTGDISQLFEAYMTHGRVSLEAEKIGEDLRRRIDATTVIGTSAGFTVVLLGVACWVFSRRDY